MLTSERVEAAAAGETMAERRLEDERYAAFAEVSVVFLDLPDAVFRGYEGDEQLLGAPRADDPAPVELLRREIARLEPSRVYFPMGIGGHVDHQLARDAGLALLADAAAWVMPGPSYVGNVVFYEDFPYAWWEDFGRLEDLPAGAFGGLPAGVSLAPEFADVSDVLERKIRAHRPVREPARPAVRGRARDGRRGARVRRARRGHRAGPARRPPSATGSRRRPDGVTQRASGRAARPV